MENNIFMPNINIRPWAIAPRDFCRFLERGAIAQGRMLIFDIKI
jgi:hypothetical protein